MFMVISTWTSIVKISFLKIHKYIKKELQQSKEKKQKKVDQRGCICIFMKETTKLQLSQEKSQS